jgi:hypothetical protein
VCGFPSVRHCPALCVISGQELPDASTWRAFGCQHHVYCSSVSQFCRVLRCLTTLCQLLRWYKVGRIYNDILMSGNVSRYLSQVSGYGLDDRPIEVRSPEEAKLFFLWPVFRPALGPTQPTIQWVSGVLSLGLKRGRGVTLTTHPHLVPRSRINRSYKSSPPKRLRGV